MYCERSHKHVPDIWSQTDLQRCTQIHYPIAVDNAYSQETRITLDISICTLIINLRIDPTLITNVRGDSGPATNVMEDSTLPTKLMGDFALIPNVMGDSELATNVKGDSAMTSNVRGDSILPTEVIEHFTSTTKVRVTVH